MLKKTNQIKETMKTKSYDVITKALSDIHGTKINKKDLYKKNNYLFVNIKKHNTIEVFNYPINEYFEPLNHLFNWYNKDFHDLVDNDVDFNHQYLKLKKEPTIKYIAKNN